MMPFGTQMLIRVKIANAVPVFRDSHVPGIEMIVPERSELLLKRYAE